MQQVGNEANSWRRARDAQSHRFRIADLADDMPAGAPERRAPRASRGGTRILVAGLTVLALSVGIVILGGFKRGEAAREGVWQRVDRIATAAGLGIDQVSLSGHRMTDEAAVFDAVGLDTAASLARFDANAAKARIERLPWIAEAHLSLTFPNSLDIRIAERKPYAMWRRGEDTVLIDVSGRVLSAVPTGNTLTLPVVAGDGANDHASIILETVAQHRAIGDRLVAAERVAGRRWSLQLTQGVTLLLPPDRESTALARLVAADQGAEALAAGNQIIDLRTDGRMFVRARGGS